MKYCAGIGSVGKRIKRLLAIALLAALLAGCSHHLPHVRGVEGTSPAAAVPWMPPAGKQQPLKLPETTLPAEQLREKWSVLSLAEAVDIALQNNPDARMAWANARAAAAGFSAARSTWLPSLSLGGAVGRAKQGSSPEEMAGDFPAKTTYTGSADLSWLIFDFGGRIAAVDESRQTLLAADWTHNAIIQNTVLQTEIAWYSCAGARAMLEAHRASLADAESHLRAAEEKRGVGLATSADVLQAKTAFSETQLNVQDAEGVLRISRGALALAMGYQANAAGNFEVTIPGVPGDSLAQHVDHLIEQALAGRPDLQAARARARAALANVRQARASLLPSLAASASADRVWLHDIDGFTTLYSGGLRLQMPLFSGFSRQYQLAKVKAEADAARELVRGAEQDASFQVFASHSDLLTAKARIVTTNDLVNSAQQSEQVALGRYKEGVGNILDLLTAQRSLAMARAQQINARVGWHIALAQLAHDIGILGVSGENPLTPGGRESE